MQFILRESFLATVGKRADSPIIVYNYLDGTVAHHIILNQSVMDIFDPLLLIDSHLIDSSFHDCFYALTSNNTVYQIELREGKNVIQEYSYAGSET